MRFLHTMLRVGNLQRAIENYRHWRSLSPEERQSARQNLQRRQSVLGGGDGGVVGGQMNAGEFAQEPGGGDGSAPAAADGPIHLGVIPNVMKFDKAELSVKAGQKVTLIFENKACALMHNFLLLKPGTKDKVGALADGMMADPQGLAKQYIPASDDILVKGHKLLAIGQTDTIEFTAPAEPGDYPYICTFPGHTVMMHGIMEVRPEK